MRTEVTRRFDVTVDRVPDRTIASITSEATMASVGAVVQGALRTLSEVVGRAGAFGEVGPGLIVHEMGSGTMTLEVFVPISHRFDTPSGVAIRTLDGGRVAATVHEGPYDQIGAAYQAVTAWVADHREIGSGPPREYYLNDPSEDPTIVPRTRVEFPIG